MMAHIAKFFKSGNKDVLLSPDIELSCFHNIDEFLCFCCLYSDILAFNGKSHTNEFIRFLEKDDLVIYSLITNTNVIYLRDKYANILFRIKSLNDKEIGGEDLHLLLKLIIDYIYLCAYWYNNLSDDDAVKSTIKEFNSNTFTQKLLTLYNLILALDDLDAGVYE